MTSTLPGIILYREPLCLQRINSALFIHEGYSSGCREWRGKLILHRHSTHILVLVHSQFQRYLVLPIPRSFGVREFLALTSSILGFSFLGYANIVTILPSAFQLPKYSLLLLLLLCFLSLWVYDFKFVFLYSCFSEISGGMEVNVCIQSTKSVVKFLSFKSKIKILEMSDLRRQITYDLDTRQSDMFWASLLKHE